MNRVLYNKFDKSRISQLPRVTFPGRIVVVLNEAEAEKAVEDTTVPKVGLSLSDDMLMLHQRSAFKPGYFIDLQDYVKSLGIEDMSLQKLYANVFHERITKREQLSNWENQILSDKQKLYASTDAWTCINLYERLHELKHTGDYELIVVPPKGQPVPAGHKENVESTAI